MSSQPFVASLTMEGQMGWLANRARRGLTNRAFHQISREVGSSGCASALYAVAIAAAVYPDAEYGSDEWDKFNSLLPKPAVDAHTAGELAGAWVDRFQMSWEECVFRIYGCDPNKDNDSSDHSVLPVAALDSSMEIDESAMPTAPEQDLTVHPNRELDSADLNSHQLIQVLNDYPLFEHAFQCDLADAATMWAITSLAFHNRHEECESYLRAISGMMYADTEDAATRHNETERKQIAIAANTARQQLIGDISDVLRESAQALAALQPDNPCRSCAEMLTLVRTFLEYAPQHELYDLTGHCIMLCYACQEVKLGHEPALSKMAKKVIDVMKAAEVVTNSVVDEVKAGRLAVENGVVVTQRSSLENE